MGCVTNQYSGAFPAATVSRLRPRVFIGSSVESHYLARGLQEALRAEGCEDVTVWSDRPPQHHQPVVEWLDEIRSDFDLAVFIAAPDDTVVSRARCLQPLGTM